MIIVDPNEIIVRVGDLKHLVREELVGGDIGTPEVGRKRGWAGAGDGERELRVE